MANMKLGSKIISGFFVIMVLLVVVGGIYQYGISSTTRSFQRLMKTDIAIQNQAGEVESFMLQCRRDEKDFLLRKDKKYLTSHAEEIQKLRHAAQEIIVIEKRRGGTAAVKRAEDILAQAAIYQKNFHDLAAAYEKAGLDHKSGFQGQFREKAAVIGETMLEHEVDDLYIALLQVRRYEKDFERTGSEKYRQKFLDSLDSYARRLDASKCDAVAKEAQQKGLAHYRAAAMPWLKNKSDANYQQMRDTSHEIETAINSVRVPGAKGLMLEIRRAEKDYLLRGEDEYVAKTHEAIAKLNSAFQSAGVLPEHVQATASELANYQRSHRRG